MPKQETLRQFDMFTGEAVDTRTAAQKKQDQEQAAPQQTEMFSQREIGQFGVTARPLLQLETPTGKPLEMTLEMEDTRSEEEIEAARLKAAQRQTHPLLPQEDEQASSVKSKANPEQKPTSVTPLPESPSATLGKTEQPGERPPPIFQQYTEIKTQFPKAIVLFRMGDFYEAFNDDADLITQELDIVLTSRNVGKKGRVRMAEIPHKSVENYIARLIEKGHHVAICDQVKEEPDDGLMPREVMRVVTSKSGQDAESPPAGSKVGSRVKVQGKKIKPTGQPSVRTTPSPQLSPSRLGRGSSYTTVLLDGVRLRYPL